MKLVVTVMFLVLIASCVAKAFADDKPAAGGGKDKISDLAYVKLSTSEGDIVLELNAAKAPGSVANFLSYVDDKFFDGTMFHRVIKGFMIQGGGMMPDYSKKNTKAPIKNEANNGLSNKKYTIAMARTSDPNSATSQFFINIADNSRLDHRAPTGSAWGYCVFGKVIGGMDVVDKIGNIEVKFDERADPSQPAAPVKPITITKAEKVSAESVASLVAAARAAEKAEWDKVMEFVRSKGGNPDKGTKTASGLWLTHIVEGSGDSPKPTDKVKVHYTGWLTNGSKFDSSKDRGSPAEFGLNAVIRGWTEGLGLMKKGGRAILVIPANLAYGSADRPGIPANSTLVFEVELLGINE